MPLIIPNTLSLIEEAVSLDFDSIINSNPILTVGFRHYDIIYTSIYYNAPHLYALEYNGNEVALARLRKILALHSNTDETSAVFITKFKEPIEERNVKEYATHIIKEETDQDTVTFHLLEGKIPENFGSLDNNEDENYIPPHQLISQLTKFVQPWT
jgi:hypothetical protein